MQRQIWAWLLLVGIGVAGRLLPHPPNFTPVEAVSIYGGAWLQPIWLAYATPVLVMAITDFILGWHNLWPFTWGGMVLGAVLGRNWLEPGRWRSAAGLGLLQSTLFFLITNFGVWLQGYYGYTSQGLIACYIAAIPFYHYQVLGALTFSTLFWAAEYTFLRRLSPATAR
ncbi:MAG: hypothetical protein NZ580_03545 [Bacteroidia bacterium]|nr:hypothetical protein [Bacteroidia bacterium]MDW8235122.1 DUF6580 family putative transport protein [Bacteroidia bacterium]